MPLTISLRFPTGRYAGTAWANKDAVEWPPHPARLCLGLLDALHRSGCPAAERDALLWLCRLPPPVIVLPDDSAAFGIVHDGVFVPQNPSQAEAVRPPRKQRSFPAVMLDAEAPVLFFSWPEREATAPAALESLVARLPRLGHSSSLVVAHVSAEAPPAGPGWRQLSPCTGDPAPEVQQYHLRVPWDGLVESAELAYDAAGRRVEMEELIAGAARGAKAGKMLKPVASPRGRHDPRHVWKAYTGAPGIAPVPSPWSPSVLLLRQTGGDRLGLGSTWALTETFHRALLDRWNRNSALGSIPSWLSGHADGDHGLPSHSCHLALFPLAFADRGVRHASGTVMGIGLALPRPQAAGLDPAEQRLMWNRALAALFDEEGTLELRSAASGWTVILRPVSDPIPPRTLTPGRWTDVSRTWASVTPVVLDRHPRPRFEKDPTGWRESVRNIIATSCERMGLPVPAHVDPSPHSVLHGAPPAPDFPPPPARDGRPPRFHTHVVVGFDRPVAGPVLLGAGRYRGYGLMMPLGD